MSEQNKNERNALEYFMYELKRINWVVYGIAVLIVIGGLLLTTLATPVVRPFFVNEATLWYPYIDSTVPEWMVAIYGIICLIIICIIEFIYSKDFKQERIMVILRLFINFAVCIGITFAFTEAIKIMTGELRPDFGYRCFGEALIPPSNYSSKVVESDSQCLDTGYDISDGRKAFPSGHSSMAFAIAVFNTLYLIYRSKTSEKRELFIVQQILFLLIFIVLSISSWICVTRIVDNKHEVADVVGGAVLGGLLTAIVYYYEFPHCFDFYYINPNNEYVPLM